MIVYTVVLNKVTNGTQGTVGMEPIGNKINKPFLGMGRRPAAGKRRGYGEVMNLFPNFCHKHAQVKERSCTLG